jgi:hypothetical protein
LLLFKKEDEFVYSNLEEHLGHKSSKRKHDCGKLVYDYVMVFKNAFQGFWDWIAMQISQNVIGSLGVNELCKALEMFYYT